MRSRSCSRSAAPASAAGCRRSSTSTTVTTRAFDATRSGPLSVVADSAPEPSHEELSRVISDERLGVPLEDALGSCVTRMQSRDLEQVALVALLQRDAGGNAAEVIDQVAYNIRTRQELRRL